MDHHFHQPTNYMENDYGFDDEFALTNSAESLEESQFFDFHQSNAFELNDGINFPNVELEQLKEDHNFSSFYNMSSVVDFPNDYESSYPVLNYLNQMLMEEQSTVCDDPLALQATETSLYDVLGRGTSFLPPDLSGAISDKPECSDSSEVSCSSHLGTSSTSCSSVDSPLNVEPCLPSGQVYPPFNYSFESPVKIGEFGAPNPLKNSTTRCGLSMDSFATSAPISSMFTDSETMLQFKKGLEEGSKFLMTSSQSLSDIYNKELTLGQEKKASNLSSIFNKDERVQSTANFTGKKHQHPDYSCMSVGRRSKQSANYEEELELEEAFDKIVLYREGGSMGDTDFSKKWQLKNLNPGKTAGINDFKKGGSDAGAVGLIGLLISCSQSVSACDFRTANQQLNLIRQHASSTGNAYQRVAVQFAKGLEARLDGTGSDVYATLVSKRAPAAEELKAFRVFLCAPFKQIFCFFANSLILEASSKATKLHIVDFGIGYGFQWPSLIKQLSNRPGGPPKLRITGIELPQSGFRPAEQLEATGHRLAEYCRRFDVSFEYQRIVSSHWDEINVEDLNLTRNEVLAVNCQWRFKSILDETPEDDCPRDAVLNLIRDMRPDIFVHDIINGQFGSPFFLTRFREALLFFSSIFDILENNLPHNDLHRLNYEQNFVGPDIVNIVACEGRARIDRPETYKQWLTRYHRAGFKLLPLSKALMKGLRGKVKEGYHKDFIFYDDGFWMMLGWKGKIITASSCLVPA